MEMLKPQTQKTKFIPQQEITTIPGIGVFMTGMAIMENTEDGISIIMETTRVGIKITKHMAENIISKIPGLFRGFFYIL